MPMERPQAKTVGEPRPLSLEMVEATDEILPRDRPRYAMGVGMPAELAGIYVLLADSQASFATGQIYGSSGGGGQP